MLQVRQLGRGADVFIGDPVQEVSGLFQRDVAVVLGSIFGLVLFDKISRLKRPNRKSPTPFLVNFIESDVVDAAFDAVERGVRGVAQRVFIVSWEGGGGGETGPGALGLDLGRRNSSVRWRNSRLRGQPLGDFSAAAKAIGMGSSMIILDHGL